MRMNQFKLHGSKVDENPLEFIDEVFRVVSIRKVSPNEKVELAAYELKGVARIWYDQWKDEELCMV